MSSEENIQQERIDKELILKQWIIENPDKAKYGMLIIRALLNVMILVLTVLLIG